MDRGLPALASLIGGEAPGVCEVCGTQECRPPPVLHRADYPFLPGGGDPMGNRNWIPAPHRIVDGGRVVYGTGDQVPLHDAVKYGLIPATEVEAGPAAPDAAPEPTAAKRGRRTRHHPAPAEDR